MDAQWSCKPSELMTQWNNDKGNKSKKYVKGYCFTLIFYQNNCNWIHELEESKACVYT